MDIGTLIALAEDIARAKHDGHLTILRFTTHWKVAFGTPDLAGGDGRDEIARLKAHPTLGAALRALIQEQDAL